MIGIAPRTAVLSPRAVLRIAGAACDSLQDELGQAVVFLLAIASVGPRGIDLCRFTGFRPRQVRRWLKRLREQGILKGGAMRVEWFEKDGLLAVMLDAMILTGDLVRVDDHAGRAA